MNPSASGWIKKHFPICIAEVVQANYSEDTFYQKLCESGFIYANSIKSISYPSGTFLNWTVEETTKINLFDALVYTFYQNHQNAKREECIATIIKFYALVEKGTKSFLKLVSFKTSAEEKLEKILQQRIQTNIPYFQKNFSHLITNALVYIDVLAFQNFLNQQQNPLAYIQNYEALLINTVFLAFRQKEEKGKYEDLVLKLLQSSLRYNTIEHTIQNFEKLDFTAYQYRIEKKYLLDIACITVYSDKKLDKNEYLFIEKLGITLGFSTQEIEESIAAMLAFINANKEKIAYFNYSNALKHFYKNTNRMVSVLILRNKNRLIKEISESKELVSLLSKSATKELNEEEKAKVKNQLLDICKSIPSLAIFILPGGSVLLPILIKFIPQLLPSAFNENKIEEQKN